MTERWYCRDCNRDVTNEDGPNHTWDTGHWVDYTFKEDQAKLTDFTS